MPLADGYRGEVPQFQFDSRLGAVCSKAIRIANASFFIMLPLLLNRYL